MREGMKVVKDERYQSVAEMRATINRLEALIQMKEESITWENYLLLLEAIRNLKDGCGPGYYSSDYYAPSRYYINENGLKNIRFSEDATTIYCKIYDRKGENIPETITVDGITYEIHIWYSKNFDDTLNY